MGLGAFTKVVGDAGVTVARRASLPVTTGNSYSASGALWAAHEALLRMRLLPSPKGSGRVKFKAMVVGANGAIGAACARLLVRAAEKVTLVSPEMAKLLALKESIFDLPPDRVALRPDVLVIESGEILLPGEVKMKNIGLPDGVAYACLAETIVLALEGRFESFTVGRAIEWAKVRETYQLGLKHGMKLAAISGVNGVFSHADIAHVRELALAARARLAMPRRQAVEQVKLTRTRRIKTSLEAVVGDSDESGESGGSGDRGLSGTKGAAA